MKKVCFLFILLQITFNLLAQEKDTSAIKQKAFEYSIGTNFNKILQRSDMWGNPIKTIGLNSSNLQFSYSGYLSAKNKIGIVIGIKNDKSILTNAEIQYCYYFILKKNYLIGATASFNYSVINKLKSINTSDFNGENVRNFFPGMAFVADYNIFKQKWFIEGACKLSYPSYSMLTYNVSLIKRLYFNSNSIYYRHPIFSYFSFTFNPYINSNNIGIESYQEFKGFDIHKIAVGNQLALKYDNNYSKRPGYVLAKGFEFGYQLKCRQFGFYTGYFRKSTNKQSYERGADYRDDDNFYIGCNKPFYKSNNTIFKPYYGLQLTYKKSVYDAYVGYEGWPPGNGIQYSLKSSANQFWLQGSVGLKKYFTKVLFFDAGINFNFFNLTKIKYATQKVEETVLPNTYFEVNDSGNHWYWSGINYLNKNGQLLSTLYLKVGIALTNKQK